MSNKMALDALTALYRGYVNTLEAGRDRIIFLGGKCDTVEKMEASDPWLISARAAIAALQAEPQGWRPIETAPKDAHALLWIDIVIGQPLVVQGCWFHDDDADEKGWIDLDGNVLNATHWMPLPAPPKD